MRPLPATCGVLLLTAGLGTTPHSVIVHSQDLGRDDTAPSGASDGSIPDLDRLAAMGMVFDSGVVASPSFVPIRADLLTG